MAGWQHYLGLAVWTGFLNKALQGLVLAIPVALGFELAGVFVRRWVLRQLGPALARDGEREPVERARRRRTLRDTTLLAVRWFWNTLGLAVILTLWRLDPVAVGLVMLALAALFWPAWRELLAGWLLLVDDCLAPGDQVVINDEWHGTVAETTVRRWRLEDPEGRTLWIASSAIRSVVRSPRGGSGG